MGTRIVIAFNTDDVSYLSIGGTCIHIRSLDEPPWSITFHRITKAGIEYVVKEKENELARRKSLGNPITPTGSG